MTNPIDRTARYLDSEYEDPELEEVLAKSLRHCRLQMIGVLTAVGEVLLGIAEDSGDEKMWNEGGEGYVVVVEIEKLLDSLKGKEDG